MIMNRNNELLCFENVSIRFNNETLIKQLSFRVHQGEKFLIYGKSGMGKTTIFRIILGFERPQDGMVYVDGQPLDEKTVWAARQKCAYVSQDLDIGSGPVQNLLKIFFSYRNTRSYYPTKQRLEELLDFFRLPSAILQEDFEKLSGGEKQRIALIITILLDRNIFLLDEATSALDPEMKMKIIDYFLTHQQWTVLSITHDRDWLKRKELIVLKVGA